MEVRFCNIVQIHSQPIYSGSKNNSSCGGSIHSCIVVNLEWLFAASKPFRNITLLGIFGVASVAFHRKNESITKGNVMLWNVLRFDYGLQAPSLQTIHLTLWLQQYQYPFHVDFQGR